MIERDRHGAAGFTLVELLVAIALFSLMSMALFGTIKFGIDAWKRGVTQADRFDETLHAQNLLRGLLERTYPLFLSDDPTQMRVDFEGTRTSVNFIAPGPMALGAGGRLRVTLLADERGHDLIMTSTPELAVRASDAPVKTTLLSRLASIEFAYFGQRRADRSFDWHDVWVGESALPRMLRVQVRFPADDPRTWPELVIAPHVTADVGCVYDPLTSNCRGR